MGKKEKTKWAACHLPISSIDFKICHRYRSGLVLATMSTMGYCLRWLTIPFQVNLELEVIWLSLGPSPTVLMVFEFHIGKKNSWLGEDFLIQNK